MMIFKLAVQLLAVGMLTATTAHSQTQTPPPPPPRPASSASSNTVNSGAPAQALNAAQLAIVKTTLAPYKPASLTADDAKLIKRSLRDAGLPRSPALDAALTAAGFSPAKLDQLDPPPPPPGQPLRPANTGAPTPPQK